MKSLGYKCCVFGCKSNYQYLRKDKRETLVNKTVFSFPKSESLERNGYKIYQTRVCFNHFHKDDVITQDIFPSTEGEPDLIVSIIDNTLNGLYIKGITIIILIDR